MNTTLQCPKCHTPQDGTYLCDACVIAAREEQESRQRLERQRNADVLWNLICPPIYRETDAQDGRLSSVCSSALDAWDGGDGKGIGLIGPARIGKTRLAFSRLHQLHIGGAVVAAISAKRFEHVIRQSFSFNPDIKEPAEIELQRVREADFLLLDDVGKEVATSRFASEFYELIEFRTSWKLPIIWTSNETLEALQDKLGDTHGATVGRLWEFSTIVSA